MIQAIFEILFLLTISCLIGIFFTRRYWKEKMRKQELKAVIPSTSTSDEHKVNHLKKENADLHASIKELEEQVNSLQQTNQKPEKPKKSSDPKDKKKIKDLKSELELVNQSLEEKERELEVVSQELEARKISYYKQIKGKRYKAVTLKMAEEAVAGQGDGRISKEDAEKIFATISDGKAYTQVEKDTMHYLRENFNWTDGADQLFRTKVRSWAAKGHELD